MPSSACSAYHLAPRCSHVSQFLIILMLRWATEHHAWLAVQCQLRRDREIYNQAWGKTCCPCMPDICSPMVGSMHNIALPHLEELLALTKNDHPQRQLTG